ncbi:MAG: alpha/beta hydrolase [Gemmatimonadaceae bacterium]|nr:alpha/beta hydrolase [Chitinophagaceae bacterium]
MFSFLFSFAILITATSFAQDTDIRYRDYIFKEITVKKNLRYQPDSIADTKKRDHRFDWFEAKDDTLTARPLIIWIHGGGFKFGNKTSRGTPLWSKTFARRGYVCAAINYRKSKKRPLKRFADLADGCFEAVTDTEAAIDYFKKNAKLYRIDTNRIILAGNSAGGMTAIQAVYSSKKDLAKLAGRPDSASLSTQRNPHHIIGVINFWGAVYDTSWLKNTMIPIISAHGKKDRIVLYYTSGIPIYGSGIIHRVATKENIPNLLKTYEGLNHELQKPFNPILNGPRAKRRWLEAGAIAADFLFPFVVSKKRT